MNDKENKGLRIFMDTNILISALLFETSISAKLLQYVIEEHELLICSYTITEASKVIERKFPKRLSLWGKFLTSLVFELTYTPSDLSTMQVPPIRDQARQKDDKKLFYCDRIVTWNRRSSGKVVVG